MSQNNTTNKLYLGIEKKCPVCKKKFFVRYAEEYVYKIYRGNSYKHVCSWKCLREYEKAHETSTEKKAKEQVQKELRGEGGNSSLHSTRTDL